VPPQFPVDSSSTLNLPPVEWLNCYRLAGGRRPRHPNRMAAPVDLGQVAGHDRGSLAQQMLQPNL